MSVHMTDTELQEIYTFALDLGRRAGKILLDGVEKRCGAESGREEGGKQEEKEKMNAVDIVTQTDLGKCVCFCVKEGEDGGGFEGCG